MNLDELRSLEGLLIPFPTLQYDGDRIQERLNKLCDMIEERDKRIATLTYGMDEAAKAIDMYQKRIKDLKKENERLKADKLGFFKEMIKLHDFLLENEPTASSFLKDTLEYVENVFDIEVEE